MWLVIIFLILLTAIVVVFSKKTFDRQKAVSESLLNEKKDLLQKLSDCNIKIADYQELVKQTKENLKESIPIGEAILIRKFVELFKNDEKNMWHESFVYYQFEFEYEEMGELKRCKVDFLIVSPSGLFVVESKCWSGVTYIYNNHYSCPLFDNVAVFKDFGKGQNEDKDQKQKTLRIFNAKNSENDNGEKIIIISAYTHPIAQARKYSMLLRKLLGVETVKNVIVFHVGREYGIQIDDKNIKSIGVDSRNTEIGRYSKIITDNNIGDLFASTWYTQKDPKDTKTVSDVNKLIDRLCMETTLQYRFKLDKTAVTEAPSIFFSDKDWAEA